MSWSPRYQDEAIMIANLPEPTKGQKLRLIRLRILKAKGNMIRPNLPVNDEQSHLLDLMFNVAKKDFLE